MSPAEELLFDVILIGVGLVGGTFACALAAKGLRVALVDAADPQQIPPLDHRTAALSSGSAKILENLGIWTSLAPVAHPIRHIRISQHNSYQVLHYQSEEVGGKPLGFMLKHASLRQGIAERVAEQACIQHFAPDTVQDLLVAPQQARVMLISGTLLKAPLVVVADGARSSLRQKLGIQDTQKSYHQKALIFNITHTRSHQDTAFEHFLPSGPLALLPFPNNESAVVWSDQTARIDALITLGEKQLLEAFQTRFGFGLGRLQLISPLTAYPLQIVFPHQMIHDRVAIIGDAAHVVHPVSAQGLNLGLRDSHMLADLVCEYAQLGLDLGSPTLLETYQKARRFDVLSTMGLTHGLIRLFGLKHPFFTPLRGAGLNMVNRFWPLKKRLLAQAMDLNFS